MLNSSFSILITTKNRKDDLAFTLQKIQNLLDKEKIVCVVFDDGSIDGTSDFVKENYPQIVLHTNKISKGYLYCRNKMLNETVTDFAISLDDDANFVTEKPLENIEEYFEKNKKAGLLGFRVFWSKESPNNVFSNDQPTRMKSFVGCAHVWRIKAWKDIPNYPEWFVFYGEEDFASYQLFKKNWEIHYLPYVLVNHRVDVVTRKNNNDYALRLQRSLRSGWYLFFLFYPISIIPRKMVYSIWIQLKSKVFKGDLKALKALVLALFDLLFSFPKIIKNANRLSMQEYKDFQNLEDAKIYWKPEK
ncbi:glycosyltransferase family 2 protein [Flavobacterium sp. MDT1-60]|uniref:glycosyltransferase family 2 protein n=1 Tax=Flavobacterium sp. MDT1-60 TaxID=1979344 RepID=UPI00177FBD3B|nr:glycosyltransferase [Flavobacterium sp. MDT1-60]QOG03816.1 glycosyltransferase [Flavobacterium sp. MDT1-60]